eukprot:gnl/MRDRNA2_/MRDRNA2_84939_c0_seq1.p1 gnl/MRDRNA2_/MRDRNA2_84939_c0~~gnl/MRDRNA2_/MRDRNA2_84939_c0_seq1.p1  ORF type:complete len:358 (-),score=32.37 gnl/MRDRNA2_/MRDRNA2_84939_c0_seq1:740-1813(-)
MSLSVASSAGVSPHSAVRQAADPNAARASSPSASSKLALIDRRVSNPHEVVLSYLRTVYQNASRGFGTDHVFPGACLEAGNLQYGEIMYQGMNMLYQAIPFEEEDVFYDLGSGTGKLTLYIALRGEIKRSVGLEIGLKRHSVAQEACSKLAQELCLRQTNQVSNLTRACSAFSVLQTDIRENTYRDATVTVVNNLCLDKSVESRVIENLMKCPSIRMIICVVQISPRQRLQLLRTVRVACTWAKVSVWSIYRVLPPPQPASRSQDPRERSSLRTPLSEKLLSTCLGQRPSLLATQPRLEQEDTCGICAKKLSGKPPFVTHQRQRLDASAGSSAKAFCWRCMKGPSRSQFGSVRRTSG